jgi:pyruvate dehydrogenase E2 component (dihydrolipoamide acetyltransferase)
MAEVILMPRLSDTMTEGVIAAWHKRVGDQVKKGDLLTEIETDKATMELESYQDGVLLHIGTPDGGKLQVNDLLAILGKSGEDISELIKIHSSNAKAVTVSDPAPSPVVAEVISEAVAPVVADKSSEVAAPVSTNAINVSNMEEIVLMPRLSDTMTEGVIASWQKNVGDTVKKGDVLADIETDKATMELESYKDGILLYQGAKAGEKIIVNDLLCIIGKEGMDIAGIVAAVKASGGQTEAADVAVIPENVEAPKASPVMASVDSPVVEQEVINEGRIFASPLAKKLAADKGIDLKFVKGSGDNGRITKIDIDNYTPAAAPIAPESSNPTTAVVSAPTIASAAPITTTSSTSSQQVSFIDTPVSQMRKVIAKRLSESLFTAPHFFLTMSINMDAAITARATINEVAAVKISFNDMILKATAMSLKQHPKVNSSWMGDFIRTNHHINIGVAVAVEDGLLVPVVRFADSKSLSQIGAEVKVYAQKAKDKKLQPADWEGSTFTISNLGMFGIDQFTAIINPPDACILAVGGISQEPVVKNGQIVVGNVMKVTLSCDHRAVDGATGSAFLQTLKSLLEEPVRMLV